MNEYKEMYVTLFRAVTLAIRILEDRKNIPQAVLLLKEAQVQCEDLYLNTAEAQEA